LTPFGARATFVAVESRVVARFRDGRLVKGTTSNFAPGKPSFHLTTADRLMVEVKLADLKAVFFVKELAGNPQYREVKSFEQKAYGQRIACRFSDGEVLVGYTQGYDAKRPGFFLIPADPKSNNERIYVVNGPNVQINLFR